MHDSGVVDEAVEPIVLDDKRNATTASNYVGTLANQLRCGREPDT
jgi:hypothetical protein